MSFRHNFLYVSNVGTGNVEIFNLSLNAVNPPSVRTFGQGLLSSPCGMAADVNTLYVVNAGSNNVQVFDITNRANPVPRGTFGDGDLNNPNAILLVGAFLHITNLNSSTVEIYHTAVDPENPVKVAEFGAGELNMPNGLAFNPGGIFLYVSNAGDSTIEIYDTLDPEDPQRVDQFGGLDEISHPIGMTTFIDTLYVANFDGVHENTISVYDLTEPDDPQFVGRFGSGFLSGPTEMTIVVDVMYVVNENANSVSVFDLSEDRRNPTHIGTFTNNLSVPFGVFPVFPLNP